QNRRDKSCGDPVRQSRLVRRRPSHRRAAHSRRRASRSGVACRTGAAMPKAILADYRSKVRKPDDFDAFWEGVLQQAAGVPLAPEMVLDPLRPSDDAEAVQVVY